MSFSDIHLALAKLQEDTIAATVVEDEGWRAESFIHAMRGLRHVKQLVEHLAAEHDLQALQRAAQRKAGAP